MCTDQDSNRKIILWNKNKWKKNIMWHGLLINLTQNFVITLGYEQI